jgi:hypothetical protein
VTESRSSTRRTPGAAAAVATASSRSAHDVTSPERITAPSSTVISMVVNLVRAAYSERSPRRKTFQHRRQKPPLCLTPPRRLAYEPSSLATTLTVTATITVPKRYDSSAWWIAARRIGLAVRLVSETWNVIPIVSAR